MDSRHGPPSGARRVLSWLLPPETAEAVLDDLDELWMRQVEARGVGRADRWYRLQVLRAVVPSVVRRVSTSAGAGPVEDLRRDAASGLSQLARHPGVGLLVATTLALGIGATTSIFSVVRGTLLRPLPFHQPGELVMVTARSGNDPAVRFLSAPDAVGLADYASSVVDVAVFGETTLGPMTDVDRPTHVKVDWVSWNALDLLGVSVARGRGFTADDAVDPDAAGADAGPEAAVISHALWTRAFAADPDMVGRTIRVWGQAMVVVGILAEDFRLHLPPELNVGADVEVLAAFRSDLRDWDPAADWFRVVARLERSGALDRARAEADAYAERLAGERTDFARAGTRFRLDPLADAVAAPVRGPVLVLFAAVTLVLLIACGNAANLLLARGAARAGEMGVRAALGAGSGRLGRQLLVESGVLAGLGAVGGVALAWAGSRLLQRIRPADLHRLEGVGLDLPVLAFAVGCATLAALVAGLLPALQAARQGATAAILRRRDGGGLVRRAREALVVGQVALSVVLLGGTGLLVRTFAELQAVPLGFDPDRILTVTATQELRPTEERRAYEAAVVDAARSVPGVEAAGIVFPVPMNGVYERNAEYATAPASGEADAWRRAYFRTVSAGYFHAMGLDVVRGRGFTDSDDVAEAPVVVVDTRLADRAFGTDDPVGRTLHLRGLGPDTIPARVVGVVEWTPQWDHRDRQPTFYVPRALYRSHEVSLVARVRGDAAGVAPALARAVQGVDARFPADLVPMRRYVGDRLARARFLTTVMQVFAAVALALTAVGLYGVLSYAVRQRRRELGVRRALGAAAGSLTGGVVGGGVRLAALGVVLGTAGAVVLGYALERQLFGVAPTDPLALGGTAVVVLAVAAAASLLPALRAARVDPAVALRDE